MDFAASTWLDSPEGKRFDIILNMGKIFR